MTDDEIDTSDIPPLSDSFFTKAELRIPKSMVPVTLHLDSDIFAWFQALGEEYEHRMNAALRIYVEAHRE